MEQPWWILVGGRRRLGAALAEDLARDHRLVLTSSRPWEGDAWLGELGKRTEVQGLHWNAHDPEVGSRIMADLDNLAGRGVRISGAVLLAGDFPEMAFGTWNAMNLEATWRVNLGFPAMVAQALGPRLLPGSALQFVLDAAIHRPFLKRLPYSAAKAGQAALIPGLARLLAPSVRVVGHALGTLMPEEGTEGAALAARTLLQRNGSAEDLVRAVRYAAASPHLTGEILTLDGGWRWA